MKQKLIAKIHVLKNQVKLEDDVYRIILERVTGKDSCKNMNMKELKAVIEEFNNTWFIQKTPKYNTYESKSKFSYVETSCSKMRKIFKLWTQLEEQAKLRDSSNKGLNSFLKTKFNTCYEDINNNFHFNNGTKDQIIEALKNWYQRENKKAN